MFNVYMFGRVWHVHDKACHLLFEYKLGINLAIADECSCCLSITDQVHKCLLFIQLYCYYQYIYDILSETDNHLFCILLNILYQSHKITIHKTTLFMAIFVGYQKKTHYTCYTSRTVVIWITSKSDIYVWPMGVFQSSSCISLLSPWTNTVTMAKVIGVVITTKTRNLIHVYNSIVYSAATWWMNLFIII